LGEFLNSPKAADARPETTKELAISSRGAPDSAAVLGEFLNSPKAADARPETTKELAISSRAAPDSAAVLGEFLNSCKDRLKRGSEPADGSNASPQFGAEN
jgi:hypothetical protein